MHVIRLSFYFRYNRDTRINVDIPVDEYIASGRPIDADEVWGFILENDDQRDQISAQESMFEEWMYQSDIYSKSLRRQDERIDIVKIG